MPIVRTSGLANRLSLQFVINVLVNSRPLTELFGDMSQAWDNKNGQQKWYLLHQVSEDHLLLSRNGGKGSPLTYAEIKRADSVITVYIRIRNLALWGYILIPMFFLLLLWLVACLMGDEEVLEGLIGALFIGSIWGGILLLSARSALQDAKTEVQQRLDFYLSVEAVFIRELRADQVIPEAHYEVSLQEYKPYFVTHTKEGK